MSSHAQLQAQSPLVSISGDDPEAAVHAFTRHYAGRDMRCQPLMIPFRFKYVDIGDDQLSIRRLQMNGRLRGGITAGDGLVAHWLTRGHARIDIDVNETRVQPGSVPALFPAGRQFTVDFEDIDQRLVYVHQDLLESIAQEQHLQHTLLAMNQHAQPNDAAVTRWHISLALAVAAFRMAGIGSQEWNDARTEVARALLHMYSVPGFPTTSAGRRSNRLAAALNYMHRNAHAPLTVSDIADSVGISVRALQEIFQRGFHQSPTSYLREIRLDNVHAELQTQRETSTTVTDVARHWGFNHMGRFSATYVDRFSEYPSKTLRSRPQSPNV